MHSVGLGLELTMLFYWNVVINWRGWMKTGLFMYFGLCHYFIFVRVFRYFLIADWSVYFFLMYFLRFCGLNGSENIFGILFVRALHCFPASAPPSCWTYWTDGSRRISWGPSHHLNLQRALSMPVTATRRHIVVFKQTLSYNILSSRRGRTDDN